MQHGWEGPATGLGVGPDSIETSAPFGSDACVSRCICREAAGATGGPATAAAADAAAAAAATAAW